ncbi:MBOAT family O-acyltransferase [Polaribacter butkevichii]|uniref:Acyltransferase n=1 Tax=Polaribacter butkevichii TaxID=218490 RepID=A0A2P6CEH8_9FLAO|nr:MBOAT family O-acyltransferase [Polaribacter butkevichii]PQJ73312.1 acyltransferase [Polaribacter butkevichii]
MLFNSFEFLVFLTIVFILYWFVFKKLKTQNILILVASYVFYGWWDWRFLSLIFLSTLVDYTLGLMLKKTANVKKRKLLLYSSLLFNLGMLGFFKYYNFFIHSWVEAWSSLGVTMHVSSLNIILPVGVSFYTFQTLSYTIDIYKGKLEPTKDFISFASFVSFFPQLVAGPIERATNLLPQFFRKREFDYSLAVSGMKLILWGLVKKVVIADSCATLVNLIFADYQNESGLALIMGAIYFAFQIYCDFSGYSDIAIGTARLFGFKLMRNFNYPYFSRDIAEFWRRWHISLSTWFRDYLYIPLGGSRGTLKLKIRNVFVIFLVSGFWHGANWTFIAWGGLNALFFLPLLLSNKNRNNLNEVAENSLLPSLKELLQILFTFFLTTFAWIFFRSETITDAIHYIQKIVDFGSFFPTVIRHKKAIPLLVIFIIIEWWSRKKEYPLVFDKKYRNFFYVFFVFVLLYFISADDKSSFIYFQF